MEAPTLACRDECGTRVADESAAMAAGWSYQSIRAAWRCGACERALIVAARMVGTNSAVFVDTLPPSSRGALPKETASTISAPTVKA